MKTISFFLFNFLVFAVFAQTNSTVQWQAESIKKDKKTVQLVLTASVQDGWYIYSQYLESDDGPVRTSLNIEMNQALQSLGKATEEGNKMEGFDILFDMNITKYKKQLIIRQNIQVDEPTTLKGFVTYMSCNDEMCLPPTDYYFEIPLK